MKKTINWTIYNNQQLIIKICRFIQNYSFLSATIGNFTEVQQDEDQRDKKKCQLLKEML